jgi:hypothetical protein
MGGSIFVVVVIIRGTVYHVVCIGIIAHVAMTPLPLSFCCPHCAGVVAFVTLALALSAALLSHRPCCPHVALALTSKLSPISHWCHCPHCGGIVAVVALASLSSTGLHRHAGHPHCAGVVFVRGIIYHVLCIVAHIALALSPTSQWRRRPCRVVAHIALALSPLLSWCLCRPRRHTSSVSWPLLQWHCCPSCCPRHARVVALFVMALSPSLCWCRCCLLIALVALATFVS